MASQEDFVLQPDEEELNALRVPETKSQVFERVEKMYRDFYRPLTNMTDRAYEHDQANNSDTEEQ